MSDGAVSQVSIRLTNTSDTVLTVILEPWANEYQLQPRATFDVVERDGRADERIELHVESGVLTFFARAGSTMLIVQDGKELP